MPERTETLDQMLRKAKTRPADEIKRTRVRGPKPTALDDRVWVSYETGQPYELGPIDADYTDEVCKLFKQSARHLTWRTGEEVKITLQVVERPDGKVNIRFLARPPMNTGTRAHQDPDAVWKARRRKKR